MVALGLLFTPVHWARHVERLPQAQWRRRRLRKRKVLQRRKAVNARNSQPRMANSTV
jgi:hypothetical protein